MASASKRFWQLFDWVFYSQLVKSTFLASSSRLFFLLSSFHYNVCTLICKNPWIYRWRCFLNFSWLMNLCEIDHNYDKSPHNYDASLYYFLNSLIPSEKQSYFTLSVYFLTISRLDLTVILAKAIKWTIFQK